MNEFFTQLAAALRQLGFDQIQYYQGDSTIKVGGFWFYARFRRRLLMFEGQEFRRVGRKYDIQKAVNLIVQELPKRLEEEKQNKIRHQKTIEARAINNLVKLSCLSVYSTSVGSYALEFTHKDLTTVRAAIDYLQDGGFCSDSPPKKPTLFSTGTEALHIIKEMYEYLSEEDKLDLSQWLTQQ